MCTREAQVRETQLSPSRYDAPRIVLSGHVLRIGSALFVVLRVRTMKLTPPIRRWFAPSPGQDTPLSAHHSETPAPIRQPGVGFISLRSVLSVHSAWHARCSRSPHGARRRLARSRGCATRPAQACGIWRVVDCRYQRPPAPAANPRSPSGTPSANRSNAPRRSVSPAPS